MPRLLLPTDLTKVAQITVSGLDATPCAGQAINVQLPDDVGTVLHRIADGRHVGQRDHQP